MLGDDPKNSERRPKSLDPLVCININNYSVPNNHEQSEKLAMVGNLDNHSMIVENNIENTGFTNDYTNIKGNMLNTARKRYSHSLGSLANIESMLLSDDADLNSNNSGFLHENKYILENLVNEEKMNIPDDVLSLDDFSENESLGLPGKVNITFENYEISVLGDNLLNSDIEKELGIANNVSGNSLQSEYGQSLGLYDCLPTHKQLRNQYEYNPIISNIGGNLEYMPVLSSGGEAAVRLKKCAACKIDIIGDTLFMNGLYYHSKCATCHECGENCIIPVIYMEYLFCKRCVSKVLTRICNVCDRPIIDKSKGMLTLPNNKLIHSSCLCCYKCNTQINESDMIVEENNIYCTDCHSEILKNPCNYCGEPVFSDLLRVKGRMFHKSHFLCYRCKGLLVGSSHTLHHNKFYCMRCAAAITRNCSYCKKPLREQSLSFVAFRNKAYHPDCLRCRICGIRLTINGCLSFHGRPHCTKCYEERKKLGEDPSSANQMHHVQYSKDRRAEILRRTGVEHYEPMEMKGPVLHKVIYITKDELSPNLENLTTFS